MPIEQHIPGPNLVNETALSIMELLYIILPIWMIDTKLFEFSWGGKQVNIPTPLVGFKFIPPAQVPLIRCDMSDYISHDKKVISNNIMMLPTEFSMQGIRQDWVASADRLTFNIPSQLSKLFTSPEFIKQTINQISPAVGSLMGAPSEVLNMLINASVKAYTTERIKEYIARGGTWLVNTPWGIQYPCLLKDYMGVENLQGQSNFSSFYNFEFRKLQGLDEDFIPSVSTIVNNIYEGVCEASDEYIKPFAGYVKSLFS